MPEATARILDGFITTQEMRYWSMRVLGTNHRQANKGVFTEKGSLTNDFFKFKLDMKYIWKPTENSYDIIDRKSNIYKHLQQI